MRLSDFKALTFDCYGTLIDWESGMVDGLRGLVARAGAAPGRDAILAAHARHESEQQAQTPAMPYARLLSVVFRRLAEEWDVPASQEEAAAYGRTVGTWPAFQDTVEALRYLGRFYKLVILSNVDNDSFAATNRLLGTRFDAIYTAEDVGSYKPSLRNFEYMFGKLEGRGIGRADILHTAESLFHDHGPANALGLRSCWIHRRHEAGGFGATMNPGELPHTDFRFTSLGAMAEAHRAETGG